MRLFNRLFLSYLPIMIGFLIVLGFTIHYVEKQRLVLKTEQDLDALANLHHVRLIDHQESLREQLQTFNSRLLLRRVLAAHPDGILPANKTAQLQNIILGAQAIIRSFEDVYLLTPSGTIVATSNPEELTRQFPNTALLQGIKGTLPHSEFLTNEDKELSYVSAIALYLKQELVGYLVVSNRAEQIIDILKSPTTIGQSAESYLVKNVSDNLGAFLTPTKSVNFQALSIQFKLDEQSRISQAALQAEPKMLSNLLD